MADYVILCDSSSDLTKPLRERFDIPDYLHGVIYFPDGHSEPVSLDWETITPEAFYTSMNEHKILYSTAAPVMGDILATFEKYLSAGKDVLSISMSSALSSTFPNVEQAAKELRKKYPQRKIICVDSKRYSTSLALLIIHACQLRDQGLSIEENAARLEQVRDRIHQMGYMSDMFFLVKTGRISNFKAFFANLAGVHLMADFNRKGIAEVLGRCKGKRDATEVLLRYVAETGENLAEQTVFVAHSNRQAEAELMARRVEETFHPKEIIINDIGMGCGASIGPGMVAVFYMGQPISEDSEPERQLMAKLIEERKNAR